jgi:hypothetical protein
MLNEGNQIYNFISGFGTVINYGSDFLISYGTVPVPLVTKLRFLRFRFHNAVCNYRWIFVTEECRSNFWYNVNSGTHGSRDGIL